MSQYGFRYYHPELGRWTARDPVGEDGGLNLYGFASNRPIGSIDWLGQMRYEFEPIKNTKWLYWSVMFKGVGDYGQPFDCASGSFKSDRHSATSSVSVIGYRTPGAFCNSVHNDIDSGAGGIAVYAIPEPEDKIPCEYEFSLEGHVKGEVMIRGAADQASSKGTVYNTAGIMNANLEEAGEIVSGSAHITRYLGVKFGQPGAGQMDSYHETGTGTSVACVAGKTLIALYSVSLRVTRHPGYALASGSVRVLGASLIGPCNDTSSEASNTPLETTLHDVDRPGVPAIPPGSRTP